MRAIDMLNMEVAFFGAPWSHAIPPCCKSAIPLLERNERVVSWIRPIGGGVQVLARLSPLFGARRSSF